MRGFEAPKEARGPLRDFLKLQNWCCPSVGGPGAAERARLAGQIVQDRLEHLGLRPIETRA